MVGLSFMDSSRHLFKYSCGLDLVEVPRSLSLCSLSYENDSSPIYVIPDTVEVDSLTTHPFVCNAPHIRFYCGASIFVDGVKIGVLCMLDTVPHPEFGPAQQATLIDIANLTSDLINHNRFLQPARLSIVEEIALQHDIFSAVQRPLQHVNSVVSQMKHMVKTGIGHDVPHADSSSTTVSPCPSSDSDSKFCRSADDDESQSVSIVISSLLSAPRECYENESNNFSSTKANRDGIFNSDALQFNSSLQQLVESLKSEVFVLEHTLDRSIQKLLHSQQEHL